VKGGSGSLPSKEGNTPAGEGEKEPDFPTLNMEKKWAGQDRMKHSKK